MTERDATPPIDWPKGRAFAFTVFDDTDFSTVANTRPVYDYLAELGLLTTKSVWPLKGPEEPLVGGATCEDGDYLAWVLELQRQGFEIGYHGATYHTCSRAESARGLDCFRELFGHDPHTFANHTGCLDSVYWGNARLGGANRLVYDCLTRFRQHNIYTGHVPGSDLYWGDLCRERIKYVRGFSFADINTLGCCPRMPYHDPERPLVPYWFASSDGAEVNAFCERISEGNQDRLEREGGACIMYTHFACRFVTDKGGLDSRFKSLMERLAAKNGWFVPVMTLLDFLLTRNGDRPITRAERGPLERRWLWGKLKEGPS